jgi:hypothetical protein
MKMTLQLVICEDDGREETIADVVILEKTCQQPEQVGLTLAEAKSSYRGCSSLLWSGKLPHLWPRGPAARRVGLRCPPKGTTPSPSGHSLGP